MEGNFLYFKKVPNQVDSDFLDEVTKICDASLAKLLPPLIKLFNRLILSHLIQLLHAPNRMQCKFAKYSREGASLENATVFSDLGSEGPIIPNSLIHVQSTKAETTMAKAASTQKRQI